MKNLAWLLLLAPALACSARQAEPQGASLSASTPAASNPGDTASVPTSEGRAALRIARIELDVEPSLLRVGETAAVRLSAFDAAGERLRDASGRLSVVGQAAELTHDGAAVIGRSPGQARVAVVFEVPASGAGPARSVREEIVVEVLPAPVTSIEIQLPGGSLYAGTRYLATARALSDFGPRDDASIQWSSSDEGVIGVRPRGLLIPAAPGLARIRAEAEGVVATAEVRVVTNPVRRLEIDPLEGSLRTGDVLHLSATARDRGGRAVPDAPVEWSVATLGGAGQVAATIADDGTFVADDPGLYRITAAVGNFSRVAEIEVAPRSARRALRPKGHGAVPPEVGSMTDLRVFEGTDGRDYAYTGTLGATMYAWDVTDPADPVITDSVKVDGRRQSDVKINALATLAAVASEDDSNGRYGFTTLDISEAAHPVVFSYVSGGFTGTVRRVWIEDDLVYAVQDGTNVLGIVDVSDPLNPVNVGHWEVDGTAPSLMDVTVQDGLAYLSHGADGLVILDVGAGIRGGTPTRPRLVSRYGPGTRYGDGAYPATRQAMRYRNYVFLGDEVRGCSECANESIGYVRVIDVTDIENPVEVAIYRVPEAGVDDLWAEADRLYVTCDRAGLRVIDVSGELRGDLYRQGREIGRYMTGDAARAERDPTLARGLQPYKGNIFATDPGTGLWIVQLDDSGPPTLP